MQLRLYIRLTLVYKQKLSGRWSTADIDIYAATDAQL